MQKTLSFVCMKGHKSIGYSDPLASNCAVFSYLSFFQEIKLENVYGTVSSISLVKSPSRPPNTY